jgi:hypothetical protein
MDAALAGERAQQYSPHPLRPSTPTPPPPPPPPPPSSNQFIVNYKTNLSDYVLERVACNFYISADSRLVNTTSVLLANGDVFYLPGKLSYEICTLTFDCVYACPDVPQITIPIFFDIKHGNEAHVRFYGPQEYLTLPAGSFVIKNAIINYFMEACLFDFISFRLVNFKESCYYIRKSTEDALKLICESKGYYEVEFHEYWMNFTFEERDHLDKAYEIMWYDRTQMQEKRFVCKQIAKLIREAKKACAASPSQMEDPNMDDLLAPKCWRDYKEERLSLIELDEKIVALLKIFDNYYNGKIFHFVGKKQDSLWTDWNKIPTNKIVYDATLVAMRNLFNFKNTYLEVDKVNCCNDAPERWYSFKCKMYTESAPIMCGKIKRFPCRDYTELGTILFDIPVILKPNAIDSPEGLRSVFTELAALPKFCTYVLAIENNCMPVKLLKSLYPNCTNRPYGADWYSYLTGGRWGLVRVCFHSTKDNLANMLIREDFCIGVTRRAIIRARIASQFPWVRNVAHCPENRSELLGNKAILREMKYF